MAFSNILWGPEGEQFNTYTAERWPMGTQLVLQDGRKFRFALNGAVTGAAGKVYQASVAITNHLGVTVQAAAAVGAKSIAVTLGATLATVNQYAEGFFVAEAVAGLGYAYKIDSHAAVASAGILTAKLAQGNGVQVPLTTATTGSFIANIYSGVVIAPITTRTMPAVGVMVIPLVASTYGWLQTRGLAAVLVSGTVVVGDPVINPGGAAGAVGPQNATFADKETQIGWVMRVAATATYAPIFLTIDG